MSKKPHPAEQSPAVAALINQLRAAVRLPGHPDAAAKFKRLLKRLAQTGFDAGADFTRRQWDQAAQAIPKDGHDAYAAGVFQAWEIIESSANLAEAKDRIMAHAVFVSPADAERRTLGARQQPPRG